MTGAKSCSTWVSNHQPVDLQHSIFNHWGPSGPSGGCPNIKCVTTATPASTNKKALPEVWLLNYGQHNHGFMNVSRADWQHRKPSACPLPVTIFFGQRTPYHCRPFSLLTGTILLWAGKSPVLNEDPEGKQFPLLLWSLGNTLPHSFPFPFFLTLQAVRHQT